MYIYEVIIYLDLSLDESISQEFDHHTYAGLHRFHRSLKYPIGPFNFSYKMVEFNLP